MAAPAVDAQTPTAPELPPSPSETAPADASALRGMRDALLRARDYAAAREPAERAVAEHRDENSALALDLLRLAQVQAGLLEADAAEATLLRSIDILARESNQATLPLMDAYRLLANVHVISERPAEALLALEQAREVSRRDLGLFNLEQIDVLDRMTSVHLGVGDTVEAQRLQEEKLETALRHFGPESSEVIPYRYALAEYYDRSRLRQHAREQYQRVLDTQEAAFDALAPELLPVLRRMLELDLLTHDDSGARRRIAEILAAAPGSLEPLEHARALAAIGDWEAARTDGANAMNYYRQAYGVLARESTDSADSFFAAPRVIDFVPPLSPVDRGTRNQGYAWGTILLGFDVDADGQVRSAQALSANPPGLMETAYTQRLGETHFRPRLGGGEPVATQNVRLTHHFRFYVEDEKDEATDE
jgi:tetratricopeptide (TPR) repeat protein